MNRVLFTPTAEFLQFQFLLSGFRVLAFALAKVVIYSLALAAL